MGPLAPLPFGSSTGSIFGGQPALSRASVGKPFCAPILSLAASTTGRRSEAPTDGYSRLAPFGAAWDVRPQKSGLRSDPSRLTIESLSVFTANRNEPAGYSGVTMSIDHHSGVDKEEQPNEEQCHSENRDRDALRWFAGRCRRRLRRRLGISRKLSTKRNSLDRARTDVWARHSRRGWRAALLLSDLCRPVLRPLLWGAECRRRCCGRRRVLRQRPNHSW